MPPWRCRLARPLQVRLHDDVGGGQRREGASTALPRAVLAPQADNAAASADSTREPARLDRRGRPAAHGAAGSSGRRSVIPAPWLRACGVRGPRAGPCAPSPAAPTPGARPRPPGRGTAASSRPRPAAAPTTSPTRPRRRGRRRPARCELRTCGRPRARRAMRASPRRISVDPGRKRELLFASTARVPRRWTGTTGTPQRLAR